MGWFDDIVYVLKKVVGIKQWTEYAGEDDEEGGGRGKVKQDLLFEWWG